MKPSTVGNWSGQKVFADAAKAAGGGVPVGQLDLVLLAAVDADRAKGHARRERR
jgi:hypothetical protein